MPLTLEELLKLSLEHVHGAQSKEERHIAMASAIDVMLRRVNASMEEVQNRPTLRAILLRRRGTHW